MAIKMKGSEVRRREELVRAAVAVCPGCQHRIDGDVVTGKEGTHFLSLYRRERT